MPNVNNNPSIWDSIYSGGRILWYPYDVVIRIIHRLNAQQRLNGIILDHGCGTGNHLEFFTRLGLSSVGTEVSPASLALVKSRFAGAKLRAPPVTLFDPAVPLSPQLPSYDHAFVWGSVHYNRRPKVLTDIQELIAGVRDGGTFILAVPTVNDLVARHSVREPDDTLRVTADISGQREALVTVPANRSDFITWCPGIEVADCGTFGWTIGGEMSEYLFLVGFKKG